MKKFTSMLVGTILLFATAACDEAKTSADSPDSVKDNVEQPQQVKDTNADAKNETRQDQLNSDIRAREQRNKVLGNQEVRDDSDLESEVRAKLEANIPQGKLTVDAENGTVKVVGTVPSQEKYDTIEPLAREIKGVNNVNVDVKIVSPTES